MTHYDVLIAGAGPAGTAAAAVLARAGASVLLLDRKTFPRDKLCAGLFTWKTVRTLGRVFGATAEELVANGVINHVSHEYRIRHREMILSGGKLVYPFHFVDRRVFDAWCLEQAVAAGAEVVQGEGVDWVDPARGLVRTSAGRELTAGHIIGADGALSTVRTFCGIEPELWRTEQGMGLEIYLERGWIKKQPRLHEDILADFPTIYSGFVHAGYGWVFPHADRVILGIGGLYRANRAGEFRHALADFLNFLGIPEGHGLPVKGHPLPYGNWLERPHAGRVLLAGDAGGMVEPFFGEGIHYALHTGELAAKAALAAKGDGASAGAHYVRALKRTVFTELAWSKHLRRLLYFFVRNGALLPVRGFLGGGGTRLQEMVHGMRSFKLLRDIREQHPES
ncbi:geranylgeranyl reductase family protein [Fundidesulfovibrio soli]|uniref:geranylgeranyl reductase family protein n=1 Tax=Fundidesulfovibrio soli TaxID=2922716 RepID=UPI001FAEE51D|nr:geranylgeranyl reductase family protein [Fundidesulfovibrio soli]